MNCLAAVSGGVARGMATWAAMALILVVWHDRHVIINEGGATMALS